MVVTLSVQHLCNQVLQRGQLLGLYEVVRLHRAHCQSEPHAIACIQAMRRDLHSPYTSTLEDIMKHSKRAVGILSGV